MQKWHRIAWVCGLTPLITGLVFFIAWLSTRQNGLVFAGLVMIYPLLLMILAGFAALVMFVRTAKRENRPYLLKSLRILALLLVNFPAAGGMAAVTHHIMSVFTVIFINSADAPTGAITLKDPDNRQFSIAPLAPHSSAEQKFHFQGEGSVTYRIEPDRADSGGQARSGILFPYVTTALGGYARLIIKPGGDIAVDEP